MGLQVTALVVGVSSALSTSVFTIKRTSGGICSYASDTLDNVNLLTITKNFQTNTPAIIKNKGLQ